MNFLTAPYEPDAHGTPLPGVEVRPASGDDMDACGDLAARFSGGDAAEWTGRLTLQLDAPDAMLFVAERGGEVLGYGRVSWLAPASGGGHGAPDGWYLSGVVVSPEHQRRGIGTRLTRARIAWAFERADAVYYVVSAGNRASRLLHNGLGFREVSTDFRLPTMVFGNDDGILCRLGRDDVGATVIDLASRRAAG